MKYLFLSYYYPPDIGAGSFRSQKFIEKFVKEVLSSSDKLYIISSSPNRYDKNLNINTKLKNNDSRIEYIKINVYNHKERAFLKILSGIKYFLFTIINIFKIKPQICICTTARTVSGLAVYIPSVFLNYKYFIDIRDLFSEVLNDIWPKNFFFKSLIFLIKKIENKIFKSALSVNLVSPGFNDYFKKNHISLKNVTKFTNGLEEVFIKKNNAFFIKINKKNFVRWKYWRRSRIT